jgi:hypothetical protein
MKRYLAQFGIKVQNLDTLSENKVQKNQSYQDMSTIKVVFPFLYSSKKKNQKDSANFWLRKMTENQNCAIFDIQYQIKPNT